MPHMLGLVSLLVAATAAGAAADEVIHGPTAVAGGRPALPGHLADVEVIRDGRSRHGRLIVTGDGAVHLEHLDEQASRWAYAAICRASRPPRGWDDRTDPVRSVWRRLGPDAVLAEVHTPAASVRIRRHQLLPAR